MDSTQESQSESSLFRYFWPTESIKKCQYQCLENYKTQKFMLPLEWQTLLSQCKKPALESAKEVFQASFQEPFLHFRWEKDGSFIMPKDLEAGQNWKRPAEYSILDSICHKYIYCYAKCSDIRLDHLFIKHTNPPLPMHLPMFATNKEVAANGQRTSIDITFSRPALEWMAGLLNCKQARHDHYYVEKSKLTLELQTLLGKCETMPIEAMNKVFDETFLHSYLHFEWEKDGSLIAPTDWKKESHYKRPAEYWDLDKLCKDFIYVSVLCDTSNPLEPSLNITPEQYPPLAAEVKAILAEAPDYFSTTN